MPDVELLRSGILRIASQLQTREWVYVTLMVLNSGNQSGGEMENAVGNRPLKKKVLRMVRKMILVGYTAPIGSHVHRHWLREGSRS